jgi:hypothetical protein
MKRFTGHKEPWGEFVDVKVNAPELLQLEMGKKPLRIIISEFSGVIREFFAKAFDIRKKFTYIELAEVARQKKVEKSVANRITELSIKMTEIEYKVTEPSISDVALAIKSVIVIVEKMCGVKMHESLEKRAEEEVKKTEKKEEEVKLPLPIPEKREKKYKMTEKDAADIKTLQNLISECEKLMADRKIKEAEKVYSKIRMLYDELHPEVKKELYNETIRIIKIYNDIMKE